MTYLASYYAHVICVALSISFFTVRGYWMLTDNALLDHRMVRISPHVIDTLLLSGAIGLMVTTRQYPGPVDWLTVKVVLLLLYIVLGMFALRRGKTKAQRTMFLALAIATFAFMVSVALARHPLGLFA